MIKNKFKKVILLMLLVGFIVIMPNYVNAAKVSVGKVKGLKASSITDTTMKLSWKGVSKATKYRVYVYNGSKKKYEYYGQTKSKSMTIKKLKSAQEQKIKIRAYRTVKGKKYYGSYSSILKVVTNPSKVKNLKSTSQKEKELKLEWNKVSRASGYRVYKYNSSKRKYEYYGQTKSNNITVKKLKSAEEYKFKVRAYKEYKRKKYYGSYSDVLTTSTTPEQVKNLKIKSKGDNSVNISWNKVSRASGYRVYIADSSNKYQYYGQTKSTSIKIEKLKSTQIYQIKVRAYKEVNKNKYYGSYSNVVKLTTKPSKVSGVYVADRNENSLKLSWNKISGATGYRVYKYNGTSKNYDVYSNVKNNEVTITGLSEATTYKFKIRAYITLDKNNNYGDYSNILETATSTVNVTGLYSSKQTENSITINWNKVSKAEGYTIYVYSQSSQSYKEKATTNNNSFEITGLDTAKFYKIYVKTYKTINGVKYYSKQSGVLSQKTLSTDKIKAGIDVSKWQGDIDWQKVKNKGIDFAILRLGWIGNNGNSLDGKFERNYNECKRLGIPVGVYVYCYSASTKKAEEGANWVAKQLKNKQLDYPVYIDMEDDSIRGLGKKTLTSICEKFNTIMIKEGFEAGVYANKYWLDTYLDGEALKQKYSIWLAHYTDKTSYTGYEMWQYTSTGSVSGVDGSVDLNVMIVFRKD